MALDELTILGDEGLVHDNEMTVVLVSSSLCLDVRRHVHRPGHTETFRSCCALGKVVSQPWKTRKQMKTLSAPSCVCAKQRPAPLVWPRVPCVKGLERTVDPPLPLSPFPEVAHLQN